MHRRGFLQGLPAWPCLLPGGAAGVLLSGCAGARSLSIGLHPWPGYETLLLARQFAWLPEGLELHEVGSALETLEGLRSGRLDGGCLTLDEVLQGRARGLELTVIVVLDESAGADVVIAKPGIERLADLAGMRIGVEKSAVGGLMYLKLLQAAGLDGGSVTAVDMSHPQLPQAWQQGAIDAAVCYEPVAGQLERMGGRRLFDSRQLPHTIFDVLAVRRDRMAGRQTLIKRLLAAHFKAIDHMRHNREDALRRVAAWRHQSFAEAARAFAGLHLPDAAGNRRMLAPNGDLSRAAAMLASLMLEHGLLAQPAPLEGLVEARYLPEPVV